MAVYPDISDYTDSVQNAARQVIDAQLRTAKPRLTKRGTPEMMSGGAAVVYPFQSAGEIWAVKCWLRDIGDLRNHYRLVEQFLSACQSEYFVNFAYIEKGIIAKAQIWPFLRMKWVGGKSLLEFVSDNLSDSAGLILLAERYLTMSQRLHKMGVAHGDLQGSNIKIVGNGACVDFKLIDYDTLVVPSFYGQGADALALPSYQHPKRGEALRYTGKEDHFSELVIYLSLLAVAERPSVWSRYPKGDSNLKDQDRHDKDMLFAKEDFIATRPTELFRELYSLSPLLRGLTLILWNYTRMHTIENLLRLEDAIEIAREFAKQPAATVPASAFEDYLQSVRSGNNAWLADTAFLTSTKAGAPTRVAVFSGSKGGSFKDLIAAGSQQWSPGERTAPIAPTGATSPSWHALSSLFSVVKKGGFLFGTKYFLRINKDSVSKREILAFMNAKDRSMIIFDPSSHRYKFTLRNPWWHESEHIVLKATDARHAFKIPLRAYPVLRDWWKRNDPLPPPLKQPVKALRQAFIIATCVAAAYVVLVLMGMGVIKVGNVPTAAPPRHTARNSVTPQPRSEPKLSPAESRLAGTSTASPQPVTPAFKTSPPKFDEPQVRLPSDGEVQSFTTRSGMAPFQIKSSFGDHYLVKLVDNSTKQPMLTIFVHGGMTVNVEVPLGSYEVRYASGQVWYGYEHLFGPDTAYSKAGDVFNFREDGFKIHGYTITLYKVLHGNLRTIKIGKNQF